MPQLNTESWRVFPDGRMETTYALKPNLAWHDGAPLTADDFVFAWRVYATPELGVSNTPPASLIEVLAGEGYITPTEADSLRIAAGARNDAAHGQLDVAFESKHLDALLAALRSLASFLPKNAA